MNLRHLTSNSLSLSFLFLAFLSFNASALGIATDAEKLKEQAELVIVGKVIARTGQKMELNDQVPDGVQEPEKFSAIMTKYDIEISNILKGSHETNTISVFSFGGQVDDLVEDWSFGFDLKFGEDVLMFLHKSKANSIWMANNHSLGVFRLIDTGGAWRVVSMNSEHVVSPEKSIPAQDHQRQAIEHLENYVNGDKE